MPARTQMRWRAAVERLVPTGEVEESGRDVSEWRSHLTDLPCLFTRHSQRQYFDGKTAVLNFERLLVPTGTDITSDDRIVSVRRGSRHEIESTEPHRRISSVVQRQQDFVEVQLEALGSQSA